VRGGLEGLASLPVGTYLMTRQPLSRGEHGNIRQGREHHHDGSSEDRDAYVGHHEHAIGAFVTAGQTGHDDAVLAHDESGRTASGAMFKVRWTNPQGEVVSEYMQALSPTGKSMGTLHIAKPEGWPSGTYKLEFLLNDAAAAIMEFEVH
jgi:hypothetical protein